MLCDYTFLLIQYDRSVELQHTVLSGILLLKQQISSPVEQNIL